MAAKGSCRRWSIYARICGNMQSMPFAVHKFVQPGINRREVLSSRYATMHIAGTSSKGYERQDFWPLLQGLLKKDGRYLDAGCGVGGWVLWLREQRYSVAGVDGATRVLRAMTEYDPDVEVKQGALTAIPYADKSFDGVLIVGSMEYEEDVAKVVREAKRVLKPGGWLFVEVSLANSLRRLTYVPLKKLQKALMSLGGKQGEFSHYLFTRANLTALLEEQGLAVVKLQPHDLPQAGSHYGLYIDWPMLRGSSPYQLNWLGRLVKAVCNAISPWIAATGMVAVARKK